MTLTDELNPIKAWLFEGSFSLGEGGQFDPLLPFHISRRTYLISI